MKDKMYEVLFRVPAESVGVVISAVLPTKGCSLISAKEIEDDDDDPAESEKPFRYANGIRNKGISGQDLAMEILTREGKPTNISVLEAEFEKHNFSASSASPVLNRLKNAGKVVGLGNAMYDLARKPK